MTLFTLAVAWESQRDSHFIEEEIRAQRPKTNDTGGWGKVGQAQVLSTHLGQTARQAVPKEEAIVCWEQHLGQHSLGFELRPLRNKAVAQRNFCHCLCW